MKVRLFSLLAVLGLAATGGLTATASSDYAPRQYYSSWYHSSQHSYYYRDYYYKPSDDYCGYKHNYCIYYPDRHDDYCYYYNPYKKVYWGRCPLHCDGHAQYSELAESDRKGSLSDIPEKAFPPMADMPPVPDSTDKVKMDLPPDDLPSDNVPIPAP